MSVEAILALGWSDRASLNFDLADKGVGGVVETTGAVDQRTDDWGCGLNQLVKITTHVQLAK